MTARLRKTGASLSLVLIAALAACTSYTEIPIETPIQPKLDVSAFQRIFIAGFIAGANEDVDANMETVRLLRSQLRNKGIMRVIDADTLPLLEVAKQNSGEANAPPAPDQQAVTPAAAGSGQGRSSTTKRISSRIQHLFANVAYWKRIGEEFQQPLIVTGAMLFAPQQRSGFVQREQESYDPFGRRVGRAGPHLHGAQGIRAAPDVHLHRRPDRRNPAHARRSAKRFSTTPTSRPRPCRRTSSSWIGCSRPSLTR